MPLPVGQEQTLLMVFAAALFLSVAGAAVLSMFTEKRCFLRIMQIFSVENILIYG
jgi:hypothetical protein